MTSSGIRSPVFGSWKPIAPGAMWQSPIGFT
jgi:hypothetical protein